MNPLPPIRQAGPADVEILVSLINAAFVVEQVAIEGDRVDREKIQTYMKAGKFLLLEDGPAILGCVYVEKRGDRRYLGLLSVDPAQQKRGLCRLLTAAAERHLQEAGCCAVDLRVISARAELLTFYGKLGYSVPATSAMPTDAPLKVPCHFIHMAKPLR
jgi:predicted N-acetyltransferase YhbS